MPLSTRPMTCTQSHSRPLAECTVPLGSEQFVYVRRAGQVAAGGRRVEGQPGDGTSAGRWTPRRPRRMSWSRSPEPRRVIGVAAGQPPAAASPARPRRGPRCCVARGPRSTPARVAELDLGLRRAPRPRHRCAGFNRAVPGVAARRAGRARGRPMPSCRRSSRYQAISSARLSSSRSPARKSLSARLPGTSARRTSRTAPAARSAPPRDRSLW